MNKRNGPFDLRTYADTVETTKHLHRLIFFKLANPGLFFIYSLIFKHTLQILQQIGMRKMTIQYMMPGFELTTSGSWFSIHNNQTTAPAHQLISLLREPILLSISIQQKAKSLVHGTYLNGLAFSRRISGSCDNGLAFSWRIRRRVKEPDVKVWTTIWTNFFFFWRCLFRQ